MDNRWHTPIKVDLKSNIDPRGCFISIFKSREFQCIPGGDLKQLNISVNVKAGTLRGMHCQSDRAPDPKLVYCLSGKLFDCVIDIRAGSPKFLQKYIFELDSEVNSVLFIPSGFVHGYQTLVDNTTILYGHFGHYEPDSERGLNPLDPNLNINWPREISEVSQRDLAFDCISHEYEGVLNDV